MLMAGSRDLATLTGSLTFAPACRKGDVMKRSVIGCVAIALAVFAGATEANAGSGRAWGIIGGMSASEVMGGPYYGAYGYPAAATYVRPLGPPPGCVIRQQRVWEGYGWRWRKLRICH
jgi:hypothetical protein